MNSNFPSAQNVAFSWQASWFVLSALCVLNGLYVEAEYFSRNLLDAGPLPGGLMFIGAEINLATVALRRGEVDVARDLSARFFEMLEHSDHMYRNSMRAVARCVLGDVELRYGSASAALAAYRSAWHIVQEHPTMMAHHRISVRALAGLASAYGATRDEKHAVTLLHRALSAAEDADAMRENAAAANLSETFYALATACARLPDAGKALELLRRAAAAGWRDVAWLESDPELIPLRAQPQFAAIVRHLRTLPALQPTDVMRGHSYP